MPQRLLLSDIDGTLLDDDGNLPPSNREALMACRHAQVTVALATGRRWTTTRRLLDRLDLWPCVDFAILNNGMVIQDLRSATILSSHAFSSGDLLSVVDSLSALEMDPIVLAHSGDGEEPDVFYRTVSLMNGDFIDKNTAQSRQVAAFEALAPRRLVEILLVGSHGDLRRAELAVQAHPVETALIKNSFYREWMLEITPRGISKFSGARFLQNHVGVGAEATMAIGDSANDLPLLKAAQHGVAMAHAPDSLKSAAQFIAGSNHEGGMGAAVMAWMQRGRENP